MSLSYYLRKQMKWPGFPYRDARGARDFKPATERGQALYSRYWLNRWCGKVSPATFEEILGTLDLLDRVPRELLEPVRAFDQLRALDVGAKNWRYLGALAAWLDQAAPAARVEGTGVELDAYRLYVNLRSRHSYARHFCELFSDERSRYSYVPGDVREWRDEAELVTWFFPFVSPGPHRAWGLPARLYEPAGVFSHVESRLARGGALIMTNQGDWEWERARSLFSSLRLRYQEVVEGSLHASRYPIFLSVWTRDE